MTDKNVPKGLPKGKQYCEKPYTSCVYDSKDICHNCGRPKGWRISRLNRARLDKIAGR